MKVSFLDLQAQYKTVRSEILAVIEQTCEEQAFILGPRVESFEKALAGYLSAPHAIGVASGSDALLLSLMAVGVGPEDEVVTSPYTFFSTVGAIMRLGAKPVFVDIDPQTYNLNPNLLDAALTPKAKAILPVHLFGQCCEMDPLQSLAEEEDLIVVEDAAQAIGAKYGGRVAGTVGQFGCFSFYPSKNLGGFGDGGMIVTGAPDLADRVRLLRVHGSRERYHHELLGCNSRLDALQAAVLEVKLRYLNQWTEQRRAHATHYGKLFSDAGLTEKIRLPIEKEQSYHVYNQYVIQVPGRDELRKFLRQEGISTEVYYPLPLHLQPCMRYLGYEEGSFPEAEQASRECLALPIYPELTSEQQGFVVEKIRKYYQD